MKLVLHRMKLVLHPWETGAAPDEASVVPRKCACFFWQSRDREEAVFMSRACIRSLTVAALKDAAIARHYTGAAQVGNRSRTG
jgi:hypothetical protein